MTNINLNTMPATVANKTLKTKTKRAALDARPARTCCGAGANLWRLMKE